MIDKYMLSGNFGSLETGLQKEQDAICTPIHPVLCLLRADSHLIFTLFQLKLEHDCTIPPPFSLHLAGSWSSPPFPATPLCHSQLLLLLPSSSPGSAPPFFLSSPKTGSCRKAREEERRVHPVFIRSCLSLSHFCDRDFPAEYEELRIGGPLLRTTSTAQLMGHFNNKSHHPPSPSCSMYFCSTTSSFCHLRRSSGNVCGGTYFGLANCPFLDSHSHS